METIKNTPIEIKTVAGIVLVLALAAIHPPVAVLVGVALIATAYFFEEILF